MTQLKTTTVKDIERVFNELSRQAGYTTTLEIKNKLRNDGFFVTQDDVSETMSLLRSVGKSESQIAPDWDTYSDTVYNHWYPAYKLHTSISYTVKNDSDEPEPDVEPIDVPSKGDWILFVYSDISDANHSDCPVMYVKGSVSRNRARAYFEREENIPYSRIGCSRIR